MTMERWTPNLISFQDEMMLIETSFPIRWKIYHLSKDMQIPGAVAVDAPGDSRATRKQGEQSCIQVHFKKTEMNNMFKDWLGDTIRKKLALSDFGGMVFDGGPGAPAAQGALRDREGGR